MKKELTRALTYALSKGFQIHPEAFRILENVDASSLEKVIREIVREKSRKSVFQINRDDLEEYLGIKDDPSLRGEVGILSDPTGRITTGEGVDGYGALFSSRFGKLRQIISERPESRMLKSIASTKSEKPEDGAYICGLIMHKSTDRNITKVMLEDPTGTFEGAVFDADLQKTAGTLLDDQFVMARVSWGKKSGFAIKDIILPDLPESPKLRSESDVYAVFLSDLHIGSKYFMEAEFSRFVSWLSSPDAVARKIRFVLIGGDVVDGVGIYPNQNKELIQQTVEEQLRKAEELIDRIPKNVNIIMMPGNHDPGRRALPQPAIPRRYNSGLWERENVFMVGNPSMVSLNGVKVMMFHGQSIDDIVKTTPGLSYDKPTGVMRHLLKARHMSPIYGSQTPIAPEMQDHMVIDDIPDIFHVGHVHRVGLELYKGVLMINSGAWQRQTPFQASVGITPNPGIAIFVNLRTMKIYQEDYSGSEDILQG